MAPSDAPRPSGRIPARHAPLLSGFLLSGLMTLIVSGVATYRNVGLPPDFPVRWLTAYLNGWVVAFPTLLVVAPVVRRLVARLTAGPWRSPT